MNCLQGLQNQLLPCALPDLLLLTITPFTLLLDFCYKCINGAFFYCVFIRLAKHINCVMMLKSIYLAE